MKIKNFTMRYDFDCGPTSIAILLSTYGLKYSPKELIKILKTTKKGTEWKIMKNFLKDLNLFKVEEQESISTAGKYLEKLTPLLVCWNVFGNPHFSHYSILIKMDDKEVTILDPEDPEKFTIHALDEYKQFWKPWRYWSVRLVPLKKADKTSMFLKAGKVGAVSVISKTGELDKSKVQKWISKSKK